jgi:NAD(P)-dependent dehydrogenase (short-subunit alcohol dehydrogenase family)
MTIVYEKNVLVTGGGGGIGRITALAFAAQSYRVAVCDIQSDKAAETVEQIRAAGGKADMFTTDIGDPAQIAALFESIQSLYGHLDAAFNNAGIGSNGNRAPLADTDDKLWEDSLRINLSGTYYCMKHELRMMVAQKRGTIVNNCSVLGIGGGISAAYTATKHGIAGLTKSAAMGYGRMNIRVNAVCPGLINAGMGERIIQRGGPMAQQLVNFQPIPRPGTGEEVANTVVWLCSDQSSYVTGHLLPVDGGLVCQ